MAKNIIAKIKNRSDTSNNWATANPILELGELGLETNTNKIKFGDGVTTWNNLVYYSYVSDAEKNTWNSKADIEDFPTSLPANGGNADTVNGLTVQTAVPSGAKFTDNDTITTINGKTGVIAKTDIVALGIPSSDTNTTYTAESGLTLTGTVFTPTFGSIVGTVAQGNDSRFTDARTPIAHNHGNITNVGAIGTTANLIVQTSTSGVLTAKTAGTTSQYFRGDGSWATPPNTTYSVISTTEINTGTATTSRVISAQRLKYITDKLKITIGTVQPTSGWWFKEI